MVRVGSWLRWKANGKLDMTNRPRIPCAWCSKPFAPRNRLHVMCKPACRQAANDFERRQRYGSSSTHTRCSPTTCEFTAVCKQKVRQLMPVYCEATAPYYRVYRERYHELRNNSGPWPAVAIDYRLVSKESR